MEGSGENDTLSLKLLSMSLLKFGVISWESPVFFTAVSTPLQIICKFMVVKKKGAKVKFVCDWSMEGERIENIKNREYREQRTEERRGEEEGGRGRGEGEGEGRERERGRGGMEMCEGRMLAAYMGTITGFVRLHHYVK
jgi:hypothetical protein